MKRRPFLAIASLLLAAGAWDLRPQSSAEFLFAARRTEVGEVIDATTLATVARVRFPFLVERWSSTADGLRLEVMGHAAGAPCCQRYLLDPATLRLEVAVSTTDRNNFGGCLTSPDGRWCFQMKSFQGPALKTVDRRDPANVHVLTPPGLPPENPEGNWAATGTWSGSHFYLYVSRPNDPGFVWTVDPGDEALGAGVRVQPFGEAPGCRERLPVSKSMVVAAGKIFLYEPFGGKTDRTGMCPAVSGGAWALEPASGSIADPIAADFRFNRLIAGSSGATLYGVVPGTANWAGPVQLIRLNAQDGTVLAARIFEPGVLQIAAGPLAAVPSGEVAARLR